MHAVKDSIIANDNSEFFTNSDTTEYPLTRKDVSDAEKKNWSEQEY